MKIREYKKYSFGDQQSCKEMFIKTFIDVDKTIKKIVWLPEYDQIIEWMTDTQGKGLALFGGIGRGKTVINSFIIPTIFLSIKKVLIPKVATELTKDYIDRWAFSIDDIGTEFIVNDYGTKMDMVAFVINNAEHYIKPLFLTGNLTEQELIQRYGLRTFDRIKRLCKIVIFTGKSLRQ